MIDLSKVRLSDEKIADIIGRAYQWCELLRLTAEAQFEACQEEANRQCKECKEGV